MSGSGREAASCGRKRWRSSGQTKLVPLMILPGRAPWWPDEHPVDPDARIVHMGPDPLFSRTPVRNFRSDLSIAGETRLALPALIRAMDPLPRNAQKLAVRRREIADAADGTRRAPARW